MGNILDMNDYMNYMQDVLSQQILQFTVPIVQYIKKEKKYSLIATGVLVTFLDKYYLITASHVFFEDQNQQIDNSKNLGIFVDNYFILFGGKLSYINIYKDKTDYNIDMAFVQFDFSSVYELKKQYKFYDLKVNETQVYFRNTSLFFIFGYPISKFKRLSTDHYKFNAYPLLTNLQDFEMMKKFDLDQSINVILQYNKELVLNENNMIVTGPDLNGLSGSGLWLITSPVEPFHFKLFGINTTWYKKDNFVLSTRISSFCNRVLEQKSDEDIKC